MLLLHPLAFFLFLAPGLVPASRVVRWRGWPAAWSALLAVLPAAAAGAIVFWAYFFHPAAGRVASTVMLILSTGCLVALCRRGPLREMVLQPDVAHPLGLMFLLSAAYLGILGVLFIAGGSRPDTEVSQLVSNMYVGNDNLIPWYFSEHLYGGTDPRYLLGDWQSSDRPPLQTGLTLVQRPLADWAGMAIVQYQILGTILQSTWVLAVWALGRQLGLNRWRLAVVIGFCTTSSFFIFHSLYVWPKLLAGTLTIAAVLLLVGRGERAGWVEVLTAALAAGLAIQAHGGAAFALFGLALYLLLPSRFPGFAKVLAGLGGCAAVLAPWTAYQRWYDPPGDRLLKWHLAGVIPIDKRPFSQTLREAYASLSLAEVAEHKWANVQALVGLPLIEPTYRARGKGWRAAWKSGEYYNLLKTLGVLNVGWLVLGVSWFRGWGDRSLAAARTLLAVVFAGLVLWLLLMFGPGTTMVYQGPYATVIMLYVVLAVAVSALPRALVAVLLVVQLLDLIVIWLIP
ncbi:MAG TPA: hypothetical protein VGY77_08565 [Gemmataceae bacterium]|nr:hypothetical protein [Gemmataceae bacterium]